MKTKFLLIIAFAVAAMLFNCKKDDNNNKGGNNNGSGADTIAKNNLIFQMKFNNNANEEKGRTSVPTNPNFTTDRFGTANMAWHNDSTNYIAVTVPATDKLFVNSVTVSMWIRAHHCTSTGFILTLINPSDPLGWDAGMGFFQDTDYKTDTLHIKGFTEHQSKDVHTFFDNYDSRATKAPWPLDKWIQVVYTYNGTNSMASMYLNGTRMLNDTTIDKGMPAGPITIPSGANKLYIGKTPDIKQVWEHNFVGDIDDVRIYDIALTETQVMQLYTIENAKAQ